MLAAAGPSGRWSGSSSQVLAVLLSVFLLEAIVQQICINVSNMKLQHFGLSVMRRLLFVSWCEQPLVLPPSLKDNLLDFGVRSATHTSSIIFVVVNSNPIEVRWCIVIIQLKRQQLMMQHVFECSVHFCLVGQLRGKNLWSFELVDL